MKSITFLLLATVFLSEQGNAQGCIPLRNIAGFGQYNLTDNGFSVSDWQLNINTRYFKSFRDFKGTIDQKTARQNEAVVKSYSTDFSLSRLFRNGWSFNLSIPLAANSREASLEHGGPNTTRRTTRTFGLGDIRITA